MLIEYVRMNRLQWIAAAGLLTVVASGCDEKVLDPPRPTVAMVAHGVAGAVSGCTAPLLTDGKIDRRAIKRAGWNTVAHILSDDARERPIPLDAEPEVREGQYEVVKTEAAGRGGTLVLTNFGYRRSSNEGIAAELPDECEYQAALGSLRDVDVLLDWMIRSMATDVQRRGELPRGGDFLLPRFDKAPMGYGWRYPEHDIELEVRDRDLVLKIVAAPDRAIKRRAWL